MTLTLPARGETELFYIISIHILLDTPIIILRATFWLAPLFAPIMHDILSRVYSSIKLIDKNVCDCFLPIIDFVGNYRHSIDHLLTSS